MRGGEDVGGKGQVRGMYLGSERVDVAGSSLWRNDWTSFKDAREPVGLSVIVLPLRTIVEFEIDFGLS